MNARLVTACLLAALNFSLNAPAATAVWPSFRGPNCSGVAAGAKPPEAFGTETNLLWKVEVPPAPSSPCVWNDRIFLTGYADGKVQTICLRAGDGKLLWIRTAPADKLEEFHPTEGSPAASTPVTDGKHLVSYFGSFGVLAYDFSGKEIWRHPLPVAETDGGFGTGCSPIIAGELVIVNRQQRSEPCLLALDVRTGRTAWQTRVEPMTSYSTPVVWERNGKAEVVMPAPAMLKAYALKTGKEQWVVKETVSFPCTTPVAGGGLLFYAGWAPGKGEMPTWAGFLEMNDKNHDGKVTVDEIDDPSNKGFVKALDRDRDGAVTEQDWKAMEQAMTRGKSVLVAVQPDGRGDITQSHVAWTYDRGLPYVPSPLYYQDRIYLIKDGGLVTCLEARTGKPVYAQERLEAHGSYYASPVAADGRIFFVSAEGKVTVVKAGSPTPEILYQTDLGERTMATPALAGKRLYFRTASKLYAFAAK